MRTFPSDVAFTPAVKAIQEQKGSRRSYSRMEQGDGWRTTVTPELAGFLAGLDMFYLATASASGLPYVQYRGGPDGFLQVLDEHTLGFADFGGNRQYVTVGNLSENPRAFLFLMDSHCDLVMALLPWRTNPRAFVFLMDYALQFGHGNNAVENVTPGRNTEQRGV